MNPKYETCEEYVLHALEEAEQTIVKQKIEIEDLKSTVESLASCLKKIQEHFVVRWSYDDVHKILCFIESPEDTWSSDVVCREQSNKARFDYLINLLHLQNFVTELDAEKQEKENNNGTQL